MGEPKVPNVRTNSKGDKVDIFYPGSTEKVAVSDSSARSSAITSGVVRLYSTTDAYITVATTPTAASTDMPIASSTEYHIGVPDNEKVAVIRKSSNGYLHITSVDSGQINLEENNGKSLRTMVIEVQKTLDVIVVDMATMKTKIEVGDWEKRMRELEHVSVSHDDCKDTQKRIDKKLDSLDKATKDIGLVAKLADNKIAVFIVAIGFLLATVSGIVSLVNLLAGQ